MTVVYHSHSLRVSGRERVHPSAFSSAHSRTEQTERQHPKMSNDATLTAADTRPVVDAMRSITTEGDRWTLAELLKGVIPSGVAGFRDIMDAAATQGVAGKLSANTLRLYRDTAKQWPKAKRVPNISFSAHREAARGTNGNIDGAVTMLNRLAKQKGGPDRVSVADVRKAVKLKANPTSNGQTGRASSPTAKSEPAGPVAQADILADLRAGGPRTIAAIVNAMSNDDLTKLHRGTSKVLAHIEQLRAKAAQKNKPAKSAPAAKVQASKATAGNRAKGDLRGL